MKSVLISFSVAYWITAALGVCGVTLVPRLLWTVVLPALPLLFVIAGFQRWRRLCPIAAFAGLGHAFYLWSSKRRRVPAGLMRFRLSLPLALLVICLLGRFVALNGDPVALGLLLVGVGFSALLFNAAYGGRAWCNHLCPVGVVERVYTDAGFPNRGPSSACRPCTGCTKSCPDLDQERAYAADAESLDARIAFYSFPGIVLGFYSYYWLRGGDWEAFFDGRWTTGATSAATWLGPGLFFAPEIPIVIAAAVTLIASGALSFAAFSMVERLLRARARQPQELGHRIRAIAAFLAYVSFYCFAGAPTLRWIPGAERAVPLVAAVVATLVLARRFGAAPAPAAAADRARLRLRLVQPAAGLVPCIPRVRS